MVQLSEIWIESILASHSVLLTSHRLRLHGHGTKTEENYKAENYRKVPVALLKRDTLLSL